MQEGGAGVVRMSQLLARLQPTSGEMVDLLWEAYNTRSWAMVQAVQQHWSPAAHGSLASALLQMNVCYTDTCGWRGAGRCIAGNWVWQSSVLP